VADKKVEVRLQLSENVSEIFRGLRKSIRGASLSLKEFEEEFRPVGTAAAKTEKFLSKFAKESAAGISDVNRQLKVLGITMRSGLPVDNALTRISRDAITAERRLRGVAQAASTLRARLSARGQGIASVAAVAGAGNTSDLSSATRLGLLTRLKGAQGTGQGSTASLAALVALASKTTNTQALSKVNRLIGQVAGGSGPISLRDAITKLESELKTSAGTGRRGQTSGVIKTDLFADVKKAAKKTFVDDFKMGIKRAIINSRRRDRLVRNTSGLLGVEEIAASRLRERAAAAEQNRAENARRLRLDREEARAGINRVAARRTYLARTRPKATVPQIPRGSLLAGLRQFRLLRLPELEGDVLPTLEGDVPSASEGNVGARPKARNRSVAKGLPRAQERRRAIQANALQPRSLLPVEDIEGLKAAISQAEPRIAALRSNLSNLSKVPTMQRFTESLARGILPAKELVSALSYFGTPALKLGLRTLSVGFNAARASLNAVADAAFGALRVLRSLALPAAIFGTIAVSAFAKVSSSIIRTTGEYELYRTQLRAVVKDINVADQEFEQLRTEAIQSPLGAKDFVESFVRLRAVGVPAARETIRALADIAITFNRDLKDVASAFIGVETEVLRRLGILLVRTGSRAFIQSQGIVRFVNNDIESIRAAILDITQKTLPDAAAQVRKTLIGRFREFRSLLDEVAFDIGTAFSPALKSSLEGLIDFVNKARPAIKSFANLLVKDAARGFRDLTTLAKKTFQALFSPTQSNIEYFAGIEESLKNIVTSLSRLLFESLTTTFLAVGEVLRATLVGSTEEALALISDRYLRSTFGTSGATAAKNFLTNTDSKLTGFFKDSAGSEISKAELLEILKPPQATALGLDLSRISEKDTFTASGLFARFSSIAEFEAAAKTAEKSFARLTGEFKTFSELVELEESGGLPSGFRLPSRPSSGTPEGRKARVGSLEDIVRDNLGLPESRETASRRRNDNVAAAIARVKALIDGQSPVILDSMRATLGGIADLTSNTAKLVTDSITTVGPVYDKIIAQQERFDLSAAFINAAKSKPNEDFEGRSLLFNRLEGLRESQKGNPFADPNEEFFLRSKLGLSGANFPLRTVSPIQTNREILANLEANDAFGGPVLKGNVNNSPLFSRLLRTNTEISNQFREFAITADGGAFLQKALRSKNATQQTFEKLREGVGQEGGATEIAKRTIDSVFTNRDRSFRLSSEDLNRANNRLGGAIVTRLDELVREALNSVDPEELTTNFETVIKRGGINSIRKEIAQTDAFLKTANTAEADEIFRTLRLPKSLELSSQSLGLEEQVKAELRSFIDSDNASETTPTLYQARLREIDKEITRFVDTGGESFLALSKVIEAATNKIINTVDPLLRDKFRESSQRFSKSVLVTQPEAVKADAFRNLSDQEEQIRKELEGISDDDGLQRIVEELKQISSFSPRARAEVKKLFASIVLKPGGDVVGRLRTGLTQLTSGVQGFLLRIEKALDRVTGTFKLFIDGLTGRNGDFYDTLIGSGLEGINTIVNSIADSLETRFSEAFAAVLVDGKSFTESFKGVLKDLEKEILRAAIRQAISLVVDLGFQALGSLAGGALGGVLGGAAAGAGGAAVNDGNANAGGFGGFFSNLLGLGGTPNTGRGSITSGNSAGAGSIFGGSGFSSAASQPTFTPFARGGVVSKPTYAKFGEAGPEAFVPLPDGRSIPVTITNSSGPGGSGEPADFKALLQGLLGEVFTSYIGSLLSRIGGGGGGSGSGAGATPTGGAAGGGAAGGLGSLLASTIFGGRTAPTSGNQGGSAAGFAGLLGGITPFAQGGVVNRPTFTLSGEAGPEAFVPLPDGRTIPVSINDGQGILGPRGGGRGGDTYVSNVYNVDTLDSQSFEDALRRSGGALGVLNGKNSLRSGKLGKAYGKYEKASRGL